MLKGKKTYIAAGLAVITALAGYLAGDLNLADAIQLGITGVIGATLRNGLAVQAG
jgi:hypothetical protein